MGRDFLAWWEQFEQDPQAALEELDKYRFVGVEFNNIFIDFAAAVVELGWEDGLRTLSHLLNEQGQIELDFSGMRARKWAKKYAAELVRRIDDSTRNMIRETVVASVSLEEPWQVLKQKLMNDYHAFSERRCETIARTESGNAYNIGAVQCWRDSGIVESVLVVDGDYCSECSAINGSTWTLEYAEAHPLQHPNCVREFFPNLK